MNSSKKNQAKSKPVASKPVAKKSAAKARPSKSTKAVVSVPATRAKSTKPVKAVAQAAPARRIITTDCIAARAHTLWDQAGRPQGRDVEYWLQAESQLKHDAQSFAA